MAIAAGAPIAASDVLDMLPRWATKALNTARQSTTTYVDDPELASISLTAGTYNIELMLFYIVASTTPKLKTNWGFSGTWNTPIRLCQGPGSTNTSSPEASTPSTFRGYTTAQDATYNSSTSGAFSGVVERAQNVVVTATGNLSLKWAQVTSTASDVSVLTGTGFRIQKIS